MCQDHFDPRDIIKHGNKILLRPNSIPLIKKDPQTSNNHNQKIPILSVENVSNDDYLVNCLFQTIDDLQLIVIQEQKVAHFIF